MARLPFIDRSELPSELHDLPLHQNFQRVYANSPAAMRLFMGVSGHVRNRTALDARLRELAVLAVGAAARSAYVFAHHVKVGLGAGIGRDEMQAIAEGRWAQLPGLTPVERAAIALAAGMTRLGEIDDATFASLERALGAELLMNLLFVIAHYIGMAALIRTLRVELEEDYRAYLFEFPA